MHARSIAIAALAAVYVLAPAEAAGREPSPRPQSAQQPAGQPQQTVLASAAGIQLPTPIKPEAAPAEPKRPRTARVTTCRCGDTSQR